MKKTLTIYGMLFLFAFTFGLSFTLASNAQAEPTCCVLSYCPYPAPWASEWGHWVFVPKVGTVCIQDGSDDCDITYVCEQN